MIFFFFYYSQSVFEMCRCNYVLPTIKKDIFEFDKLSSNKTEIFSHPIISHHDPHHVNPLFHDFKIRLT